MDMNFTFDAGQVKPLSEYSVLPEGWYNVIISEFKPTAAKSGKGGFMALTMKIIDGEHKGNTYIDRLNLWNENATAVEIANASLSAICHVVGHYRLSGLNDFVHLTNKPFKIRLVVTTDKQTGKPNGNDIKGYRDANDCAPGQSAPASAPAPQQAPMQSTPVQPSQAPVQNWGAAPQQAPTLQTGTWGAPQQTAPVQPAQQPQQTPVMGWTPPAANSATPGWAQK